MHFISIWGLWYANINSVIKLFGCKAAIDIPSYAAPIGNFVLYDTGYGIYFDVYREKIKLMVEIFPVLLFYEFFPTNSWKDRYAVIWTQQLQNLEGKRIRSKWIFNGYSADIIWCNEK